MAFPFCQVALISLAMLLYNLMYLQFGSAADTMVPSQGISVGETLASAGKIFELGFFNPLNSSRRYIGIWYREAPQTVVWVANREKPLSASDQSARLILNDDGNLRLLDGKENMVWSTNLSVRLNSSIAVLSDNGDFILKDSKSGQIAWESFQHVCDVFLKSMSLQFSTKMGAKPAMYSWSSADDPSPGKFSVGAEPETPVQIYIWKGSAIHWRSGPWNGITFVGIPDTRTAYTDTFSITQDRRTGIMNFSSNDDDDDSSVWIIKLFPEGFLTSLVLQGNKWLISFMAPDSDCDVYGKCGAFAVCSPNESPICSCLKGFSPKSPEEWSKGNWTDGCTRRTELSCSKNSSRNLTSVKSENDGFQKLSAVKLPDIYHFLASEDGYQGCQDWCIGNCSCSAFAYVNGIGCLVWTGDLIDLQKFSSAGEDLFVRLADSELAEKSKHRTLIVFLISALVVVIVALLTYALCRCRAKRKESCVAGELNNLKQADISELPTFDFEKILAATDGFSVTNKIGEGGFGPVFKGKLQDGQEIAVKRLLSHAGQGTNEFRNEILLISKLQHRNLVKILGCSIRGEEKLIVYEYLVNRSLDTYLFDPAQKKQLNWALRFNIIQSIARGLSYLHRDSRLRVIHRDMKASNILLDHDMNPKISDFGLARTFQSTQESANTLRVVGTFGYMSPEYAMRGIISEKSDVFSFGVLILEIVSGRRNNSFTYNDQDLSLITHAWRLWNEGRELEMIDESMLESYSETEVERCIIVGLLCVQDHADDRPTMSTVVMMLSSETPLPRPKQPTFVPQNQSHSPDFGSIYSVNEVTDSQVEGR